MTGSSMWRWSALGIGVCGGCTALVGLDDSYHQDYEISDGGGGAGAGPQCTYSVECPQNPPCAPQLCIAGECVLDLEVEGTPCGEVGEICTLGQCFCPADQHCGGVCVDLGSDPGNCGECFNECLGLTTCVEGVCVCPQGMVMCDGACVDLDSDAVNCGSCGRDCLGSACAGGLCVPESVSSLSGPRGLEVTSTYVFWAASTVNSIRRASLLLASPYSISSVEPRPFDVASADGYVYWTNEGVTTDGGSVRRCSTAGGVPLEIAPGQNQPRGIAVGTDEVYWTNFGSGQVLRAPIGGGAQPVEIASLQQGPESIVLPAGSVHVYWANTGGGSIMRASLSGGSPELVAQASPSGLGDIAVQGENVYWTDYTEQAVMKGCLCGGGSMPVATGQSDPLALAVDATHAYWVNGQSGTIMKAPLDGSGEPIMLAQGQSNPTDIAVNDTHVYWIAAGANAVRRVAK